MAHSTGEKLQKEIAALKEELDQNKAKFQEIDEIQKDVKKKQDINSELILAFLNLMTGLQNEKVALMKRLAEKEDALEKLALPSTPSLMGPAVPILVNQQTMASYTDEMMDNLTRMVKKAIGSKAERLNIEALRMLLHKNWQKIFGRQITVAFSAHKFLKFSKSDVSYHDFIDLRSYEQHEFYILYSSAIQYFCGKDVSEATLQTFCGHFFEEVIATIQGITNRHFPGELDIGANVSYEVFTRHPTTAVKRSYTCSGSHPNKRLRLSSGSSMSTQSASVASRVSSSSVYSGGLTTMTSSLSQNRPDIIIKDADIDEIYFVAELKRFAHLRDKAEAQLKPHAFLFNQNDNSRVYDSFGAVVIGNYLYLYYFEQRAGCLKKHEITRFYLRSTKDRIKLVTDMIILCYIISLLSENKTRRTEDHIPTICRKTCSLQFLNDGSVLKLVDLTELEKEFNFKNQLGHLQKLYQELKEDQNSSIVNSLRCKAIKHFPEHNTLLVHLLPRGEPVSEGFVAKHVEKFVDDVLAFLESLHSFGYVHGDLRLANIVKFESKDKDGKQVIKFVVIDYENIRPICKLNQRKAICSFHMKKFHVNYCSWPSLDFYNMTEILSGAAKKVDDCGDQSVQIDLRAIRSARKAFEQNQSSCSIDANNIRDFIKK